MELWGRALRDRGAATARQRLDDRWRGQIAEVIRDGRELGEFEAVDADDVAAIVAAVLDGLAVQVTLGDRGISAERMRDLAVKSAELLVGCPLPPVDAEAIAVGSGEGAE
jgi:hypothetical protein